jgi:hypothetical protein
MRILINYETTKVSFYRFICNDSEIKSNYVGHTTNFIERKACHKQRCNNTDYKLYQIIRDNGGFDNWKMIEIECRLVKDKREAERIEQEWVEKFEADMNSRRAYGNKDMTEYDRQYAKENADKISKYQKEYHLENADKLKEKRQQYRLENADKIKEKKQQEYLDNKQLHNEKSNQYWLNNKEYVKNQKKEEIKCECGCITNRGHIQRHQKTKKHIKLMELKNV